MAVFQPWSEALAAPIIEAKKHMEGAMLPVLHALQETFGYIPADAVPMIAETLNLSRAEVHGVVTFYHDFRRTPPGRHTLHVCRAEACQAVGGNDLIAHAKHRLAVGWHETTRDGAITLEPVFCLGLCAVGPAALLDGQPLARLTPARFDAALEHIL